MRIVVLIFVKHIIDDDTTVIAAYFLSRLGKTHFLEDDVCFWAAASFRFSLPSDALECFDPPYSDPPLMQYDLGHGIKTSCDSNCEQM